MPPSIFRGWTGRFSGAVGWVSWLGGRCWRGLVRPVPVVVVGVLTQDRSQMLLAIDQDPVGALGPCGRGRPLTRAVADDRASPDMVAAVVARAPLKVLAGMAAQLGSRAR